MPRSTEQHRHIRGACRLPRFLEDTMSYNKQLKELKQAHWPAKSANECWQASPAALPTAWSSWLSKNLSNYLLCRLSLALGLQAETLLCQNPRGSSDRWVETETMSIVIVSVGFWRTAEL